MAIIVGNYVNIGIIRIKYLKRIPEFCQEFD